MVDRDLIVERSDLDPPAARRPQQMLRTVAAAQRGVPPGHLRVTGPSRIPEAVVCVDDEVVAAHPVPPLETNGGDHSGPWGNENPSMDEGCIVMLLPAALGAR